MPVTEPTIPEAITEPAAPALPTRGGTHWEYYRSLLSEKQQTYYDQIVQAINIQSPQVKNIRGVTREQLEQIMDALRMDHPEFFWLDNEYQTTMYTGVGDPYFSLELSYVMDAAQREQTQARLDAKLEPLLADLEGLDEWSRLKRIYDYLIDNSVYLAGDQDQAMTSLILDGAGVCAAYAKATKYLAELAGLPCIYITGDADNGTGTDLHAWNIVRVNGANYEIDTTWGDPVNEDGTQTLRYDYFCLTTDEMNRDHTRSKDYVLPICTAIDCNYYRKCGLWFESYDEEKLYALCRDAMLTGETLSVRFSDQIPFDEVSALLTEGDEPRVAQFCRRFEEETGRHLSGWVYTLNEKLGILDLAFHY